MLLKFPPGLACHQLQKMVQERERETGGVWDVWKTPEIVGN